MKNEKKAKLPKMKVKNEMFFFDYEIENQEGCFDNFVELFTSKECLLSRINLLNGQWQEAFSNYRVYRLKYLNDGCFLVVGNVELRPNTKILNFELGCELVNNGDLPF